MKKICSRCHLKYEETTSMYAKRTKESFSAPCLCRPCLRIIKLFAPELNKIKPNCAKKDPVESWIKKQDIISAPMLMRKFKMTFEQAKKTMEKYCE